MELQEKSTNALGPRIAREHSQMERVILHPERGGEAALLANVTYLSLGELGLYLLDSGDVELRSCHPIGLTPPRTRTTRTGH